MPLNAAIKNVHWRVLIALARPNRVVLFHQRPRTPTRANQAHLRITRTAEELVPETEWPNYRFHHFELESFGRHQPNRIAFIREMGAQGAIVADSKFVRSSDRLFRNH